MLHIKFKEMAMLHVTIPFYTVACPQDLCNLLLLRKGFVQFRGRYDEGLMGNLVTIKYY